MGFLKKILGGPASEPEGRSNQQILDDELEQWSIVTADNEETGEHAVFRLRTSRPETPQGQSFSTAVSIGWSFESDSGMPSPETMEVMNSFEDGIDPLTWLNGFSELMYVATGNGEREWLFYSSDQERFMGEFNSLLADHQPYPLRIEFIDDPEWTLWGDIAEAVAQREAEESQS